jgi:hypothetical protein
MSGLFGCALRIDWYAELLSEQISYIEYLATINAKFTPEVKGLSIVHVARIPNIPGLVYSIYQYETSFPSAGLNCKQQEVSGFGYLVFSPGLPPQISLSETNESEDSGRA